MYLKFYFVLYFYQAATLGYILQGGKKFSRSGAAAGTVHQGLHLPEGPGTRAECGDAARILWAPASHLALFPQPLWFACF